MIRRYHNPVSLHFGDGSLERLPALLAGRSAVLVTFPEAESLGLVERVRSLVGAALVGVEESVRPNPDVAELAGLHERFWREHLDCEVVLAVGGGSAIDTAKALLVATPSGRFDELGAHLASGTSFRPSRTKSLIAVPTTAGTGSEVTPWATIWDRAAGKKYSLELPETWPEAAIVDPGLMLTLPAAVTLQSGLDALSHALESVWNVNANEVSDALAVSAARGVIATLPALMDFPLDRGLRERMAVSALKAGLAFSNTRTALAHSISYEMTLRFGLPHGIACSFTLPMVLGRAIGIDAGRDAVLAEIFGSDLAAAPPRLESFLQGLGIETSFGAYGADEREADAMIRHALSGVRGRNFIGAAPVA